jgi:GNAT superfamily N-acetyltransferase
VERSRPAAAVTTTALRDGRAVAVTPAAAGDAAEVARLVESTGDPRAEGFARVAARTAGALVARAQPSGELVGYCAWAELGGGRGELVGAVDPAFTGIGLGTLLLRSAAERAQAVGLRVFRVELHVEARALAAMLRDCGLRSHWDLEHPVAHVELSLGERRPGWATP